MLVSSAPAAVAGSIDAETIVSVIALITATANSRSFVIDLLSNHHEDGAQSSTWLSRSFPLNYFAVYVRTAVRTTNCIDCLR